MLEEKDDDEEPSYDGERVESALKMTMQKSSAGRLSVLQQLSDTRQILAHDEVHYSTIGADRATPEQTERIRPSPTYTHVSKTRPKALKQLKPCKDRIDLNALRRQPASARNMNKDLTLEYKPKVRKISIDGGHSTIMEATADEEMEKIGLFTQPEL